MTSLGTDQKPSASDEEEPLPGPVVTAGPVSVTPWGGLPFVAVTESVRHMSGRRFAGVLWEALTKADCTIERSGGELESGERNLLDT